MMKTNIKKRAIAFIVALTLCVGAVAASAVAYSSNYISTYTARAIALSSHRIQINVSITATQTMSQLGASQIDILESNGGSSWRVVRTYTPSELPDMMSSGIRYYNSPVIFAGIAGHQYKASVTCYAKNASGSSSRVFTTDPVTAIR